MLQRFLCVLRKCRKDKTKNSADALANKLLTKNDKEFWKEIKKLSNNRVPIASTVNNVTVKQKISQLWRTHFKSLLNSSEDSSMKSCVLQALSNSEGYFFEWFTVNDVSKALKSIKHGKSASLDDIYGEHFIYARECINVLLCLVFNSMIIHGYLPEQLLNTIIVLLVKDKKGDLTDIDNYRPLVITCISS